MMTVQSPFPYLIDPQFTVVLTGRWAEGGVLEVRAADSAPLAIPLPAALWAVTAILIQAAKDADPEEWARSFVTVHELVFLLFKKTGLGNHDPENVIRLMFRLRRLLEKSGAHQLADNAQRSAATWSKRLIERQRFLGYRISLPPENLRLEILDAIPPR